MSWLPSPFLEASNGTLLFILAAMFLGDMWYIISDWRKVGGFWGIYFYRKAAVALAFFLGGLLIRTGIIWYLQHVRNFGYTEVWWAPASPWLIVLATIASIVGGMCWLRVTANQEDFGKAFWLFISLASIVFGFGMAMQPETFWLHLRW